MSTKIPTQTAQPRTNPSQGAGTSERSAVTKLLGEIEEARGQATRAATTSAEILALLTNGATRDPLLMIEMLIRGIAEQGEALRRIEARLEEIEGRLGGIEGSLGAHS